MNILTQIVEILENSGISYEISRNPTEVSVSFQELTKIVAETTETSTPERYYPPKPEGEGWISNRGNYTQQWPDNCSVCADDDIEFVTRCGDRFAETARSLGCLWKEIDDNSDDVVWFRIVK
jgi:hypothetical protein